MDTPKKRITKTNLPTLGSMITAGGKVYIATGNAHFVDSHTAEMIMSDPDMHWIIFNVPAEDEILYPEEVIYFDDLLMCECLFDGKPITCFWEGNWNCDEQESGKIWDEIPSIYKWSVFT